MCGLPDEDVEPDADGEGVGQIVPLFGAFVAWPVEGLPCVPFVEADLLAWCGWVDLVLDSGEVDQGTGDLDASFCCPWCC